MFHILLRLAQRILDRSHSPSKLGKVLLLKVMITLLLILFLHLLIDYHFGSVIIIISRMG